MDVRAGDLRPVKAESPALFLDLLSSLSIPAGDIPSAAEVMKEKSTGRALLAEGDNPPVP